MLIASRIFVDTTYRNVIKNYLLLFQHDTVFRLRVRGGRYYFRRRVGRVISFSPKVKNIVKEEDWKGRGVECLRSNAKPQRRLSVCRGTPDFSNPYWYNVILMLATPVPARLRLVNIERYRATREYRVTFGRVPQESLDVLDTQNTR